MDRQTYAGDRYALGFRLIGFTGGERKQQSMQLRKSGGGGGAAPAPYLQTFP